jgi:hypothetical protein
MSVLVDTRPLYAAADRSDRQHSACAGLLRELVAAGGELLVPVPVVVETCWLLGRFVGPQAEATFLDLAAGNRFSIVGLTDADLARAAELVRTYAGFPLGIVDASVVAVAERLEVTQLFTVDRRHFPAVRPRHIESFTLLP